MANMAGKSRYAGVGGVGKVLAVDSGSDCCRDMPWRGASARLDVTEPATGRPLGEVGPIAPDLKAITVTAAAVQETWRCVAPVVIAGDDGHAIALANDTEFRSAARVQVGSVDRGLRLGRRLHAGRVRIDDLTVDDRAETPLVGMGRFRSGSRFGGLTAWGEFTEWQGMAAAGEPARPPVRALNQ